MNLFLSDLLGLFVVYEKRFIEIHLQLDWAISRI